MSDFFSETIEFRFTKTLLAVFLTVIFAATLVMVTAGNSVASPAVDTPVAMSSVGAGGSLS